MGDSNFIPGLVSVIVPCYNSSQYVGEAIRSLCRQTYKNLEVIIVDDGSTDDSRTVIDHHAGLDDRIRVFTQHNSGLPSARNAGIRNARGEFVCFLDADDILLPDKLDRQIAYLCEHPACDLVYSDYLLGDQTLKLTGFVATYIPDTSLSAAYARRQWFGCMAPMLRSTLLSATGLFDESLPASEDWDFWIRCSRQGNFGYLPGACAVYRQHGSQMHSNSRRMFEAGRRVIDKHFRSDKSLYPLALACYYWTRAKREFRMCRPWNVVVCVCASQYYSVQAGGVSLRLRDADATILPVPAEFQNAAALLDPQAA